MTQTFEGQYHFAGLGPEGTLCHSCRFWGGKNARRNKHGWLKSARCALYVQARKRQGLPVAKHGVPPTAPSCKHFSQRMRERPYHNPPKDQTHDQHRPADDGPA